ADLLVATGAAEGQAIGLFFPNSARFVAALLGAARVGCTAILFPPALTSEEFRYYCQAAGTQIVLSTPTFRDRLEAAGGRGLIGGTLAPLCQGGRVILRDRYKPEEVTQFVARERATILYAVPVTYRAMVTSPLEDPPDLSSLRLCFSAGAPLFRDTEDQFAER